MMFKLKPTFIQDFPPRLAQRLLVGQQQQKKLPMKPSHSLAAHR